MVLAAGCVVWRYGSREPEVLLVHRPRYDDWSYAKGKLDRGEALAAAAVREVEEETGLRVQLGPRLPDQQYPITGRRVKNISYWAAPAPGLANITTYEPNHEIDEVRWAELTAAKKLLSYERDVALLKAFRKAPFDSTPLVILRHTKARRRKTWKGEDPDRPLLAEGREQARRLIPIFDAYGITRVISSDAARCVESVLPYVNAHQVRLSTTPGIAQDEATTRSVRAVVRKAVQGDRRTLICSHRPVLPMIFEELGVKRVALPPGGFVVVHRRGGEVLKTEVYT
jgi:8-oxo-dGTP diphosphatase